MRRFPTILMRLRGNVQARIWNSLFVRLLPYVIGVVLLPVAALTTYHLLAEYRFSEAAEIVDSQSLSQKLVFEIQSFVRTQSRAIRYLALDLPVDSAADYTQADARERTFLWLADHLAVSPDALAMFLFDRNGGCVVATDAASVGRDVSSHSMFRAASRGEFHVSDWTTSPVSGVPGIYLSAPVVRRHDIIGVMAVKLNVAPIAGIVARGGGSGASLLLFNRSGRILTQVRPTGREFLSPDAGEWRAARRRVVGTGRPFSGRLPFGGETVLAFLAPCGINDWTLGIAKPISAVHQKARRILGKGVLAALISVLLAVALSFVLFFRISRPLLELSESVRRFSQGQLDVRSPIHDDNEIGALAAAFNHMAQTIQEQTGNLERKVQERTLALEEANREIRQLSVTDPLTQCFNRRYMEEHLQMEIARAGRFGQPLSVMLLDLDHFKSVNDNFGHLAGDRVLRETAAFLQEQIRHDVDWIVRFGGEELLVVLPGTPLPGAVRLAERIRQTLAGRAVAWQEQTIRISASFGVTGLDASTPEARRHLQALLARVDALLYEAKDEGRNRVCAGALI